MGREPLAKFSLEASIWRIDLVLAVGSRRPSFRPLDICLALLHGTE